MGKKIYVEKYGCTLQKAETGLYVNKIMENGDVITEDPESADLRIIGTCAVIRKTEEKMYRRIQELSSYGRTQVMGCLPPVSAGTLEDNNIEILPKEKFRDFYRGELDDIPIRNPEILDGIPINQGCTGSCNYCISRVARGRLLSRLPEKIKNQAYMQIERGIMEIRISSLDTAAYGKDTGLRLPYLIRKICEIDSDFMLRVGMMEPKNTNEIMSDLIDAYENKKVFKFLHIPVQSGDDRILELMNREYTADIYEKIVHEFRKKFPEITISTDIIVGYPGEEQESFEKTASLIERTRPDIVNITRFSPRQFTKDFEKNFRKSNVAKKWSEEYSNLHKMILNENLSKFLGRNLKVMITEKGTRENTVIGRDINYRPVVMKGNFEKYTWVSCEIVETGPTYLIGRADGSGVHPDDFVENISLSIPEKD